jgi:hypothetical protein
MLRSLPVAAQFKKAFEDARENNIKLAGAATAASPPPATEEEPEETAQAEGDGDAEGGVPASTESDPPAAETRDSEKAGEE